MRHETSVLLLTVLSLVLLDPGLSDCDPDGPADCTFDHGHLCGWLESTGMNIYDGWTNDYLEFNTGSTARIESRTACQTLGYTDCLTFRYRFEESNVLDLNVILKGSQTGETVVWTMSSSVASAVFEWDHASVPITRDKDFTVIIEAKKRDRQNTNKWVRIDSIKYKGFRSCSIYPGSAKPPTTTTKAMTQATTKVQKLVLSTTETYVAGESTSQYNNITTKTLTQTITTAQRVVLSTASTYTAAASTPEEITTATNPMRTSISDHGEDSANSSSTGEVSKESASHAMTPVTANRTTSGQSSYDVIAIVGAVVGLVLVVVIVVVLLIVLKRTQLSPCLKRNKNRGGRCDVAVPHNVTHNLNLDNQGGTDDLEMTACRGPLESGTSPQPPENHFSVIHTAGNHPTQQPPHQIDMTTRSPSPDPPLSMADATDDNPYEMTDEVEAPTSSQPTGDETAALYHLLEDGPDSQLPHRSQQQPDTTDHNTLTSAPHLSRHDGVYTLAKPLLSGESGTSATRPDVTTASDHQRRQLSVTSQGDDGDYNSLDLGGRRRVVERGEWEGPGQVYSGLNEGNGDTYSEVNHHKRRMVVDDQYSHLQ